MNDVFPTLEGYETMTEFMQKRCLLEFIMFRHIINQKTNPTIREIIHEASINTDDEKLYELFQAVSQNKTIFISHKDLYEHKYFSMTMDMKCFLDADPFVVNLMLKRGGIDNVFSFDHINSEQRKVILGELFEKISLMQKIICN
jgi:hypothetical protein